MTNLDTEKRPDDALLAAKEAAKRESRKEWRDTLVFIVIAIALVIPIRLFVAQPFLVEGTSMDPTFHDGEYLIVDEISYRFETPPRGDVIVFKYPCPNPASEAGLTECPTSTKYFIKRIIGLPGEKVAVENGLVKISKPNGDGSFTLSDSYIVNRDQSNMPKPVILGSDEYFVMGDNRPRSFDSRAWGPVKRSAIVGRTLLRVLPLNRATVFPGSIPQS